MTQNHRQPTAKLNRLRSSLALRWLSLIAVALYIATGAGAAFERLHLTDGATLGEYLRAALILAHASLTLLLAALYVIPRSRP